MNDSYNYTAVLEKLLHFQWVVQNVYVSEVFYSIFNVRKVHLSNCVSFRPLSAAQVFDHTASVFCGYYITVSTGCLSRSLCVGRLSGHQLFSRLVSPFLFILLSFVPINAKFLVYSIVVMFFLLYFYKCTGTLVILVKKNALTLVVSNQYDLLWTTKSEGWTVKQYPLINRLCIEYFTNVVCI